MNPLLRLLQRFRRTDTVELRRRQESGAGAQAQRAGVFGRLRGLVARRRSGIGAGGVGVPATAGASYTTNWLKTVREWNSTERQATARYLQRLLAAPDFSATLTERRYQVPGLEGAYSGASLLALNKVLSALAETERR